MRPPIILKHSSINEPAVGQLTEESKADFFRRNAAHANFSVEIQLKIHYNIAGAAMPCLAGICPN